MGSKTTLQENEGRGHYNGWMIFNFRYVIANPISSKFREAFTTIRESQIKIKCRNRVCRNPPAMAEDRGCELVLRHQKYSEKSTNFTDSSSQVDEQLS
ncbi:hypothetical protein Pyn_00663 [Prunus yedoensis var. nudiflora]|uniref:Uncharacterized protein n=1 Tax=Prunus yedoensis var. nudiflora TaxID=2094558 RepID=A0A314XKU6_PRUYE|nr:hypothetical protein Pyn_00663 [Prunus yedoensis var. nudiflora]